MVFVKPKQTVSLRSAQFAGQCTACLLYTSYVPADVSVIGFDTIYISDFVEPALTTISQPSYEMGRKAARMLLDAIEQPGCAQENVVMEPTLVERRSVRKVYRRLRR